MLARLLFTICIAFFLAINIEILLNWTEEPAYLGVHLEKAIIYLNILEMLEDDFIVEVTICISQIIMDEDISHELEVSFRDAVEDGSFSFDDYPDSFNFTEIPQDAQDWFRFNIASQIQTNDIVVGYHQDYNILTVLLVFRIDNETFTWTMELTNDTQDVEISPFEDILDNTSNPIIHWLQ